MNMLLTRHRLFCSTRTYCFGDGKAVDDVICYLYYVWSSITISSKEVIVESSLQDLKERCHAIFYNGSCRVDNGLSSFNAFPHFLYI